MFTPPKSNIVVGDSNFSNHLSGAKAFLGCHSAISININSQIDIHMWWFCGCYFYWNTNKSIHIEKFTVTGWRMTNASRHFSITFSEFIRNVENMSISIENSNQIRHNVHIFRHFNLFKMNTLWKFNLDSESSLH